MLVPKSLREGTFYLVYESLFNVKVVTKVVREPPEREEEKVVAVKTDGKVLVFEEMPERLAEELGIGGKVQPSAVRRQEETVQ